MATVLKIREESANLRKRSKDKEFKQAECLNIKVFALPWFLLMVSVPTEMPYQGVRKISLMSGTSLGRWKSNSDHPAGSRTIYIHILI